MKYWLAMSWFWILCLCLAVHIQMKNISELKNEVKILQVQYQSLELRSSGEYETYSIPKVIKPKNMQRKNK